VDGFRGDIPSAEYSYMLQEGRGHRPPLQVWMTVQRHLSCLSVREKIRRIFSRLWLQAKRASPDRNMVIQFAAINLPGL
jgi:hypothetical protein